MLVLPIGFYAAPPASGASLLLDSISTTVRGAFSLRKLRSAYSGSAIRVRRSSDSTEQDIGFASGALDTSALTTFVGSGNGFISKWYDQSTIGADLVQATTGYQPQIVFSGSVRAMNNATAKPGIKFTNGSTTSTFMGKTSWSLGSTTTASAHVVADIGSGGPDGAGRLLSFTGSGDTNDYSTNKSLLFAYFPGSASATLYCAGGITSVATPSSAAFQLSAIADGTNGNIYCDSSSGTLSTLSGAFADPGQIWVGTEAGNAGSNEQWNGNIGEVIITSGTLSSTDQTTIRSSQKTYYGTA